MNKNQCFISVILCILILVLPGCLKTNIIEQSGNVVAIGYDAYKNGIKNTTVFYQVDPRAKEKVQVVVTSAKTSKGSNEAVNIEVSKKSLLGQLRVAIYSQELSRHGILSLVDAMSRDPSIGTMVYLAVSEVKAEELLTKRYPEIANIGSYLYGSLRQNIREGNVPSCTLHEFLRAYYSQGDDPVLPIILSQGTEVRLNGLALFNGDRYVGKLPIRNGFFIKIMKGKDIQQQLEIRLPGGPLNNLKLSKPFAEKSLQDVYYLAAKIIDSKSKLNLTDPHAPKFTVNVSLDMELNEIPPQFDLTDKKVLHTLNQEINKKLTGELNDLIRRLQSVQSDVVGFGEIYRSKLRGSNLTRDEWHEKYRKAEISCSVKVHLIRTGILE